MMNAQLELSLENARARCARNPRQRRLARANWWFQRMRQIVDHALDWEPRLAPRPQQMVFPGAHREIVTGNPVVDAGDERQICE
jgi:hypothetical protein